MWFLLCGGKTFLPSPFSWKEERAAARPKSLAHADRWCWRPPQRLRYLGRKPVKHHRASKSCDLNSFQASGTLQLKCSPISSLEIAKGGKEIENWIEKDTGLDFPLASISVNLTVFKIKQANKPQQITI